jgi:esterase/lipase superfamily enzyme
MPASINTTLRAAVVAVALNGCAARPSGEVLIPVSTPTTAGTSVIVLAATTRERAKDSPIDFTANRSADLNYQEYKISIPPNHVPGQIQWPSQSPGNAQTDFIVTSNRPLTEPGFTEDIQAQLASRRDLHGSVLVFIHGYNTSHQEAVFRVAGFATDLRAAAGAMVAFSWPSRAMLTGYVTDRESVTYSRDYLERVLNEIAGVQSVRSINLVAHSLGSWLAMETLRQAELGHHAPFLKKLNQVVLLSPDIDVDVFRTQLEAIGNLSPPIIIAISKNDRALAASQLIAGGVSRVGNVLVDNPHAQAAIERYGIVVVDLSHVNTNDVLGHSKFADVLPELQDIASSNGGNRPFGGAGIFVFNGAGQILSAPAVVGNALLRQ